MLTTATLSLGGFTLAESPGYSTTAPQSHPQRVKVSKSQRDDQAAMNEDSSGRRNLASEYVQNSPPISWSGGT